MLRVDISNEIVTTLHTLVNMLHAKTQKPEPELQLPAESNIIQLRFPLDSSRGFLRRKIMMNHIHSLQPWQQGQIITSLRDISKIIYSTADECVEMAEIIKSL